MADLKKELVLLLLIFTLGLNLVWAVEQEYSELYLQTVGEDIRTSSFYELSVWCGRLELSTDGSADQMRSRLYKYYKVETPGREAKAEAAGGNLITIETADNLDYFTIEKIDENYVEIVGDVVLILTDEKNGEKHKIKADKIIFNFKEDYLTATGNIEYILESAEKTENYRGDKITFNVETWEGLFYKGISQEDQKIDDKDVTFYFKGDLINKTEDNFVILEKGEITSCDLDSPHFKLKAEKLWMLSEDEWAILSGVLYIGRVPMLYIPAFLMAGDEIFFNPVFGHMNDYGYFLQTTTYLIGEKAKDDSTFSFLQSDESSSYNKLSGIYLTADDEVAAEKKKFIDSFADDDYLKLILDYYSSLGLYGAINGEINKLLFINDLSIQASIARTRKIELLNNAYTHLFADDDGIYGSIWESSFFYDVKLPFRYDLDLSLMLELGWFDFDLVLQSYSDNYYKDVFSGRTENLDLLGMLNASSTSSSTATAVTSADWEFIASFTPELDFLKPWVSKLSISSLQTSIDWRSKKIDSSYAVDSSVYDDTVDYFFFPQEYILPSFSAELNGQLLPFGGSGKEKDEGKKEKNEAMELRPPWGNNTDEIVKKPDNIGEFLLPDILPDIEIETGTVWGTGDIFTNKLLYSIKPTYFNKTQLKMSDWNTPEDIDITDIEYSVQAAGLVASLSYKAGIFGDFISIMDTLKFTGNWGQHYNMGTLTADEQEKFILEDNQASELTLLNSFQITARPLMGVQPLSGSKLTYYFYNEIYDYDYSIGSESFLTRVMMLDSDSVTKHSLELSMPLVVGDYKQTLTLSSTIPPIDLKASGTLLVEAGISKTQLNTAISESDDVLSFDPLTLNERLSFMDDTYIDSSISYNYEQLNFEKNITSGKISLFDKDLTLTSKFIYDFTSNEVSELSADLTVFDFFLYWKGYHTEEYDFNVDSGWQSTGSQSFQAKDLKAGLNSKSETYSLWKNRIKFDYNLNSFIDFDLVQFTDSVFNFSLAFDFEIFEFLTLTLKSVSENTVLYKYITDYTNVIGVSTLNIFEDLLKSFNFFDINDRYESNFNLKTISVGLSHDLHDWDLNVDYSGKPWVDESSGIPKYEWENKLSIYLKWKSITDIKTEIEIDKGDISF
ncbi:MAG: LPS-assembly protein LptD [Spirochaetales bacterium]|nr:LPS-assembly protein LptD [Spirochaetales bacterium]